MRNSARLASPVGGNIQDFGQIKWIIIRGLRSRITTPIIEDWRGFNSYLVRIR
jgi:hypothetical protein